MQLLPLETPPPLTNSHWTCAGLSYLTEVPLNNFLLIHWIYKCKLPSTEFVCYIENKFKNSDSDASWRNPMWLSVYCFLYLFMFEIFHLKQQQQNPGRGFHRTLASHLLALPSVFTVILSCGMESLAGTRKLGALKAICFCLWASSIETCPGAAPLSSFWVWA